MASIRLRYAFLQSLNSNLEHYFLPLVDLRPSQSLQESTAALLVRTRGWLFYDTKVRFFNTLLDATAQRKVEQAAPEVTLDPLQVIGSKFPFWGCYGDIIGYWELFRKVFRSLYELMMSSASLVSTTW